MIQSASRPHPKHSLLTRTVILVCLPLLVAVMVAVTAAVTYTGRDAADALADRAQRMVEILAGGATDALWNFDRSAGEALLRPLLDDPDFAGVRIVDSEGEVFLAHGKGDAVADGEIVQRRALVQNPPGRGEPKTIGTLELRLTSGRAGALARERAWTIAAIGLSLLILVCATLALILRGVTMPIRATTRAMADLAAGRIDITLPRAKGRDEVAQMAEALATLKEHAAERLHYIERQAHHVEEIERRVDERTRELRHALDTLHRAQDELVRSEKMAALGGMVAAMAHEINTPLGNSLTVATTLADKLVAFRAVVDGKELRRSTLREYVDSFDTAGRLLTVNLGRAATLIGGFKRVAVDQTSERRRAFDLQTVCGETIAMLWPSFKNSGGRIEQDIEPGIAMDSFPGALGQVVTNLVSNAFIHAFDASRPGVVRVAAGHDDEGQVVMSVSDDGRGVPTANLARIFDPFFTTKLGAGGSGLGLHIVYALVNRVLGGQISVASVVGYGTCFTLILPRVAPAETVDDRPAEAPADA